MSMDREEMLARAIRKARDLNPDTLYLLNCVAILLSSLRNFEEAVGEKFDDEGGDIAAIEREFHAGALGVSQPSAEEKTP